MFGESTGLGHGSLIRRVLSISGCVALQGSFFVTVRKGLDGQGFATIIHHCFGPECQFGRAIVFWFVASAAIHTVSALMTRHAERRGGISRSQRHVGSVGLSPHVCLVLFYFPLVFCVFLSCYACSRRWRTVLLNRFVDYHIAGDARRQGRRQVHMPSLSGVFGRRGIFALSMGVMYE